MRFENIKYINLNARSSWQDKIFLTFDIDWCSDELLLYALNFIEEYKLKATFFVTHETGLLERMRDNENIELGIHPNFNPLLSGDFRYGKNIDEVVSYYKKIVPEAVSVRSHSMTQNSLMLDSFEKFGLIYDVNTFIPFSSEIVCKPYKHWTNKLVKVPYFWEDDVHCNYEWDWNVDKFLNYSGIKVFDFHPIHIYLNTEHLDRYEQSRKHHNCEEILLNYVNSGYGSKSFFLDLIREL
jgi:hypothetical protein